jgi:hypothetical protein
MIEDTHKKERERERERDRETREKMSTLGDAPISTVPSIP